MELDNTQKSNIISFAAGFIQCLTFILAFCLWKYYAELTTTQNMTIVGLIVINEALGYILMRIANIISKQ